MKHHGYLPRTRTFVVLPFDSNRIIYTTRSEPSSSQDNGQSNVADTQSTVETLALRDTQVAPVSSAIATVSTLAEGAGSTEPSSISHRLLQRTQSMLQDFVNPATSL